MTKKGHLKIANYFLLISCMLVMIFAIFICQGYAYAEGETYSITITDYETKTILTTLTEKTTYSYSDIQYNEQSGYAYSYYLANGDELGAQIETSATDVALSENITIYQVKTPLYKITIVDYDTKEALTTLADRTSYSYSDIQYNETDTEYNYLYYLANGDALGAQIETSATDVALSEDITIYQVKAIKPLLTIYYYDEVNSTISTTTPYTKYQDSFLYLDLQVQEETGYTYEYYYLDDTQDNDLGSLIDTTFSANSNVSVVCRRSFLITLLEEDKTTQI